MWLLMNLREIFKSWGFVVGNGLKKKKVENFVEKLRKLIFLGKLRKF